MMRAARPLMPDDAADDALQSYIDELQRQRDRALLYARVTGAFALVIGVLTILLLGD